MLRIMLRRNRFTFFTPCKIIIQNFHINYKWEFRKRVPNKKTSPELGEVEFSEGCYSTEIKNG